MKKFILLLSVLFLIMPASAQGRSLSWDLGYSIGSTNGESYSEANLGLNWSFTDWLVWRNALFGRFYSSELLDDTYGLDTSARFNYTLSMDDSSHLHFFGGPGWRFASEGESPPFAEGGINIRMGGLNIGGGAKVIFNEVTDSNIPNDTQYFITFSGSGTVGGGDL